MQRAIPYLVVLSGLLFSATTPAKGGPAQNPFQPGQCTAAVWKVWVQQLGHPSVPSTRSATFWWDDAPGAGYFRSIVPPQWPSIMVLGGWPQNPLGHVAVTLETEDLTNSWGPGWSMVYTVQWNWSPSTVGNGNAPLQFYWVAVDSWTQQVWYWYPTGWGAAHPLRGFVWR
ncbi:MAG TPA: CHAP domain-containing protein [Tepidisphaeraceae bacterium]|nr:CHAP domain-containing protein [Tepidisphaeraceae bacterium]